MPTISTIIITKNEAHDIEECIKSALWTDEIVILDCGSTDGTQQICKKYAPKVKLHETDWPGFGPQKNRALSLATSEWILSIDADERVTPELKEEILQTLDKNNVYAGYQIKHKTFFLNRPLNFCGKRNIAPIRLAQKNKCSFSEDIVHEVMRVNGKAGKFNNPLSHYSWRSIEELLTKTNEYSSLSATKLAEKNHKSSIPKAILRASWIFIRSYFLRLGFLDGWPGFIVCLSSFEGTFYKYAKLIEKTKNSK